MRLATPHERNPAPVKENRSASASDQSQSTRIPNPFRWVGAVGYYYDEEVGTYYVRARTYDAKIARWLSQDPLFWPIAARLLYHSNLFLYSNGAPTHAFDPSGLYVFGTEVENECSEVQKKVIQEVIDDIRKILETRNCWRFAPCDCRNKLRDCLLKTLAAGFTINCKDRLPASGGNAGSTNIAQVEGRCPIAKQSGIKRLDVPHDKTCLPCSTIPVEHFP